MNKVKNCVKVAHVLADHEGEVATSDLFVVLQVVWVNSLACCFLISGVSELVTLAHKHSSWNPDLTEINHWWVDLAIILFVDSS